MIEVELLPYKLIESSNIDGEDGSFGIDSIPFQFEKCREKFALEFKMNTPGFFFKHPVGIGKNIAVFIRKTEMIIKQTEFSSFAPTNRNSILWVEPSPFWRSCRMRRSLFTILLRAGCDYEIKRDNYEQALFREQYLLPTQKAVMRFLFGFTKYVGPNMEDPGSTYEYKGWKYMFEAKDELTIKSYLVSPDGCYKSIPELKTALWA